MVGESGVLRALMSAEVLISLNFGIPAAVQWADHFVFPTEVWEVFAFMYLSLCFDEHVNECSCHVPQVIVV